jgi:hypothetical protein
LAARRGDAQIGDLPEGGVNAKKQDQHNEAIVQFGSHKLIGLVFIVTRVYAVNCQS